MLIFLFCWQNGVPPKVNTNGNGIPDKNIPTECRSRAFPPIYIPGRNHFCCNSQRCEYQLLTGFHRETPFPSAFAASSTQSPMGHLSHHCVAIEIVYLLNESQ